MALTKSTFVCLLGLIAVCLAMPRPQGGFGNWPGRPGRPVSSSGSGFGLANTANNYAAGFGSGTGTGQLASFGTGVGFAANLQIPGGPSYSQSFGQGFGGGY